MKSYLQQLLNNEAILLMYLADELPKQDRFEVEQMLASDGRLRAELENLRLTHQLAMDSLESLDDLTRPPVPAIVAQTRMIDLTRRWSEAHRRPAVEAAARRSLPWWRTMVATAAGLMVGTYIWAVYHAAPPVLAPEESRSLSPEEKLALLSSSLQDNNSDDPNMHLAEIAAAPASEAFDDLGAGNSQTDSN
jgi:anti-sigma factor RsiW